MDELLIEDKRYVSSKRAAKMTGYAKDYIGQLCREGRVPARLVGRSWYVLESAIHDHRFGGDDVKPGKESTLSSTWESPRYESAPTEQILPVSRLEPQPVALPENEADLSQQLQDSWKAWFDRVSTQAPATQHVSAEEPKVEESEEVEEEIKTEGAINVPVRTIYRRPPEELLPRQTVSFRESEVEEEVYTSEVPHANQRGLRAAKTAGVVLAFASLILAAMGTGYFDKYIISSKPVSLMAGVILYNR